MAKIHYISGDATNPRTPGNKIICHVCNDKGRWGAGFVLALSRKWSAPEESYRECPEEHHLGVVQLVPVEADITVANMIAQHDTGYSPEGLPPIRYAYVRQCLNKINLVARKTGATIHMPRIGCGLAGGQWDRIERIINQECTVDVYVYDLPGTHILKTKG
jgi:O-acetyl-ADP-ribose deacetylase (regulator of RNase III)